MGRSIARAMSAAALVAACVAPGRLAAQGPADDATRADASPKAQPAPRLTEVPRLASEALRFPDVGKLIQPDRPLDTAKPFAAWSASAHSLRDSILVSFARTQIGTRYVRGGQTPKRGFDCSGLVRYVLGGLNIPLPRTAALQAQVGQSVGRDTSRLRPGDLLTFSKSKRGNVSHIGIYLGNGRFVHASSVAGRVIESNLDRPSSPKIKPWRGTRRVVGDTDDGSGQVKGDG